MSLPVSLNSDAWDDLEEIERYLSERFSERNAQRFTRRIIAACHKIGLAPHRGTRKNDLEPNVRIVGFDRTVSIVFEINVDSVVILGLHYRGQQPG